MENLDFDNTEIAFSYMNDKEIKRLKLLFSVMNNASLVSLGTRLTPLALKLKIPFFKSALRATIFKQFVGGEDLNDATKVIELLKRYNTLSILDYGAESKTKEEDLDQVVVETKRAIEAASTQASVPVVSTKLTGLADNDLLIKLQTDDPLTEDEKTRRNKLVRRLDDICKKAYDCKVGIMVDAEESWMQVTIDKLVEDMMATYNKTEVIVFNTFQLYRHDKLDYLKECFTIAQEQKYLLGAKLVRGAYMDKENNYAEKLGIPTLINATKNDTDHSYDQAIEFCVTNHKYISSVCASHNRKSNKFQAQLIDELAIDKKHPHLNFCQLYGMSDNLTFNLANAGYNVAKYVPYGPLAEVIPYLMRRAKENSSVTGDMSRELTFIKKEVARRGF